MTGGEWVAICASVGTFWYGARAFARLNRNRPIVSKEDDGKLYVRRDIRRTSGRR